MKHWNNKVVKVVKYFAFFAYYPTLKEIYTFLQARINKNSLNIELERMDKLRIIKKYKIEGENTDRYTVGEYGIRKIKNLGLRTNNSKKKLNDWRFRLYTKLISVFPQIKLVGLSGSISMMNAEENDDIDLFIITAKNRLFTGRLITLILAQILGLRRSRNLKTTNNKDKVCLNLFFDESNLKVPKIKQTEFVGHEILQMRPIIDKQGAYEHFLKANKWVFRLFPNSKEIISNSKFLISNQFQISNFKNSKLKIQNLGSWIESQLKIFQINLINRHKTSEIITSTQLWFHPEDFEKKIKRYTSFI